MESVEEPWEDAVDIAEYTPRDFQSREYSVSVSVTYEEFPYQLQALIEETGLDPQKASDRMARIYLAHLCDTYDSLADLRERCETVASIPPRGWVSESNYPLDAGRSHKRAFEDERLMIGTRPVVAQMMEFVTIDESIEIHSLGQFVRAAVRWTGGHMGRWQNFDGIV